VTDDRLLGIYLNDHLAGATGVVQRCRAARDASRGSEAGAFLDELLAELVQDRRTLLDVLAAVAVEPSPLKRAAGVVLERVGRLKPNGQLRGYSPLGRFLDLEVLSIGVEGKRLLWLALREIDDGRLARFDFGALAARAQDQRERLEPHRLAAASAAFV
jgi:hypothetical protein